MGAWCLGLCTFICPVLDSMQDSLQFLLSFFSCSVIHSCFGNVFQRHSSSKGTGTSHSLVIFRNSTVFRHMLFLVMFHIDPSLFTLSKLLFHLTIPSALYVRTLICPHAFTVPFVLATLLPILLCGPCRAACLCMVCSGYFC